VSVMCLRLPGKGSCVNDTSGAFSRDRSGTLISWLLPTRSPCSPRYQVHFFRCHTPRSEGRHTLKLCPSPSPSNYSFNVISCFLLAHLVVFLAPPRLVPRRPGPVPLALRTPPFCPDPWSGLFLYAHPCLGPRGARRLSSVSPVPPGRPIFPLYRRDLSYLKHALRLRVGHSDLVNQGAFTSSPPSALVSHIRLGS